MPTIHERVDTLEDVLREFIINTKFSSLYLQDDVVEALTKAGIYAMAMKDDTMDLLNFKAITG